MSYNPEWNLPDDTRTGLSYNEVLDITDIEPSGGLTEPVTLAEAKNFCKIDVAEDDVLIEMLITACRLECEALTNIGFVQREVIVTFNNGNGGIFLPLAPVGTITDETNFTISGNTWKQVICPTTHRQEITYQAGYKTLPSDLKLALLECIYFRYDERKQRESSYPPVYIESLKKYSRVW